MNTVSGDVWTYRSKGWVQREANSKDHQRRALIRSWQRGDLIVDQHTHEHRPMRYADVLSEVRQHGIAECECAP